MWWVGALAFLSIGGVPSSPPVALVLPPSPRQAAPRSARGPWLLAALSVGFVLLNLGLRFAELPIPAFGLSAEYATHDTRLAVLAELRTVGLSWPGTLLHRFDGAYPPLLHITAAALGAVVGQEPASLMVLGPLFWLLYLVAAAALTRAVAPAAAPFVVALLAPVPVLHGSALRYYHDLPAASWWLLGLAGALHATAHHATSGRRASPVRAFALLVGAGFCWSFAVLTKWTLLPWLAVGSVLVALWARTGWAAVALLLSFALIFLVLCGFDPRFASFSVMAASVSDGGAALDLPRRAFAALGDGCSWWSIGEGLVRSAMGPLLTALWVVIASSSRLPGARDARRWALLWIGAHLAVVAFLMPIRDERLHLQILPAIALVPAMVLAARWESGSRLGPVAVSFVGAFVVLDLHWARAAPWAAPWDLPLCFDGGRTPWRGVVSATSSDTMSVLRRDDEPHEPWAHRQALGQALAREPERAWYTPRGGAILTDRPDNAWLAAALREAEVLGDGEPRRLELLDAHGWPYGRAGCVLLSATSKIDPGQCSNPRTFTADGVVLARACCFPGAELRPAPSDPALWHPSPMPAPADPVLP